MSAIGVVTGSNSLVTVPVMFQLGIEPKIAIATNMFGLTFLNIGATLPFLKKDIIDYKKVKPLVWLTLVSSALGALLVGYITSQNIKLIVTIGMICVAFFTLLKSDAGIKRVTRISTNVTVLVYILTFLLGIYGGLYSGGYTTLLTTLYVAFFGMTFTEAVAGTKLINIFSSGIATIIFAWQGLIDYKLGIILAITMFIAAYFGAKTVTKLNDIWLKRIFLFVVFLLALKMIFDFILR
jgi:uncharacterized membrane protein YfcA